MSETQYPGVEIKQVKDIIDYCRENRVKSIQFNGGLVTLQIEFDTEVTPNLAKIPPMPIGSEGNPTYEQLLFHSVDDNDDIQATPPNVP